MKKMLLFSLAAVGMAFAQTESVPLPEKLKKLQENYDAAIARANAPITSTYIKELEKLKAEFTKAGDLKAALATDEQIEAANDALNGGSDKGTKLSEMSERQFKRWLSSVVITEVGSPNGIMYTFEDDTVNTMWSDMRSPRVHKTATIEVGRLIVPFTNTVTTIVIDPSMTKAEVTYTGGSKYPGTITEKKRR
ncbi:MAG: hypothetical protein V4662_25650 [Verrucomicrobiota bacterium]